MFGPDSGVTLQFSHILCIILIEQCRRLIDTSCIALSPVFTDNLPSVCLMEAGNHKIVHFCDNCPQIWHKWAYLITNRYGCWTMIICPISPLASPPISKFCITKSRFPLKTRLARARWMIREKVLIQSGCRDITDWCDIWTSAIGIELVQPALIGGDCSACVGQHGLMDG